MENLDDVFNMNISLPSTILRMQGHIEIDQHNNLFRVFSDGSPYRTYKISDFIDYDIIFETQETGGSDGSIVRGALGGYFFGWIGAALGYLSGRTAPQTACTSFGVSMLINGGIRENLYAATPTTPIHDDSGFQDALREITEIAMVCANFKFFNNEEEATPEVLARYQNETQWKFDNAVGAGIVNISTTVNK